MAVSRASTRISLRQRQALAILVGAIAASFVPVTHARSADYTDELTFRLVAAERAHPSNTSPRAGLANVLQTEGETSLACTLHASVTASLERQGETRSRRYLRGLENLGTCLARLGRYAEAAASYDALERIDPSHARLHMERGYLKLHTLDLDASAVERSSSVRASYPRSRRLRPCRESARTSRVSTAVLHERPTPSDGPGSS